MKIPDYRSASDRRARGTYSCLDYFITEFQPVPPEAEDFREGLQNVIDEAEWRSTVWKKEEIKRLDWHLRLMVWVATTLLIIVIYLVW